MRKDSSHINKYRIRKGPLASEDSYCMTGSFYITLPSGAKSYVISSEGLDRPGMEWKHVSVSILKQERCPTWQEMCYIKDIFWDHEECVFQLHPPRSKYVNNHPYCLHLWKPLKTTMDLPDSILVGLKDNNSI